MPVADALICGELMVMPVGEIWMLLPPEVKVIEVAAFTSLVPAEMVML